MIKSLGKTTNPANTISGLLEGGDEGCVAFEFDHTQHYSTGLKITVGVICCYSKDELRAAFSTDLDSLNKALDTQSGNARHSYKILLADLQLVDINLRAPLKLDRLLIPKPWGQEIWYTGIEERGVCSIHKIPLPWILEVFASMITGTRELTPILLKILDPSPHEVYGDLYFELHQKKREVYIVTHIDKNAWPDSTGKIRLGFCPDKVNSYADAQQFKDAYLASVEAYRQVRNKIDAKFDEFRLNTQAEEDEPGTMETIKEWQDKIEPELAEQEMNLRDAMNEFTAQRNLHVGDVIHVNPHVPHSLPHGVRVVEFQTPHYERYILSFAQKVLTQDHWDTERALDHVQLDLEETEVQEISETESLVADFEEFRATRIVLQPGMDKVIDADTYCLVIGVKGRVELGKQRLDPEDGYYITACASPVEIRNTSPEPATFLIAQPTG